MRVRVLVVLLAVAATLGAGFAQGYRAYVVATPSMATAAPVGTLVITHPRDSYRPGEVITYRHEGRVYTHRVTEVTEYGYVTKGDLNGVEDPWTVLPEDVVGGASVLLAGFGWLVRALPLLIGGFLLVHTLSRWRRLRDSWRWPVRIGGASLVATATGLFLHPWTAFDVLTYRAADGGGALVHLVNTGLLPLRVGGKRLLSGQDAVVHTTTQAGGAKDGFFEIAPHLALGPWSAALLIGFCLLPLALAFLVRDDESPETGDVPPAPRRRRSRPVLKGVVVVAAAAIAVTALVVAPSQAAFTSRITNSGDKAGTRTWFTCTGAEQGTSGAYFAYPLDDPGLLQGLTAVRDTTGNNRPGAYSLLGVSVTSDNPCVRDGGGSALFDGVTGAVFGPGTSITPPQVFSVEIWFKSTKGGGKLIGFGDRQTTKSGNTDRHLYLNDNGQLIFGVGSGHKIVSGPSTYIDGTWHHAVGTLSAAGMRLYVDGALVDSDATVTAADTRTGWWRIGWDNLGGWPQDPKNDYFAGRLADAAVYTRALSQTEVTEHYQAGRP